MMINNLRYPIRQLGFALQNGTTSSRHLVELALAAITAPSGQGAVVFTTVNAERARAEADACDRSRRNGGAVSPIMGIPISVKDLFDIEGEITTAGSIVLAGEPAAKRDATAIARLRAAGAIIIGRTNMSEFAFSGLGVNEKYGTPLSPYDRPSARVAGGSSSGAAASVADGMAVCGIGTDTGGSVRIPAALCSLTGYKPTARRIPLEGVLPLSPSLDSVGSIGHSVDCCAIVDALMAGEKDYFPRIMDISDVRLGVLTNDVVDGMDSMIASAYEKALTKLSRAGAILEDLRFDEYREIIDLKKIGFPPIEAYAWHKRYIEKFRDLYDPRVLDRLEKGSNVGASDYIELIKKRELFISKATSSWSRFDAVVLPTVPMAPPSLSWLGIDDNHRKTSSLLLRNPSFINYMDGCAVSIPIDNTDIPASLMLATTAMGDERLLTVALSVERVLTYKSA